MSAVRIIIISIMMLNVLIGCSKAVSGSRGLYVANNPVTIDMMASGNCVRQGDTVKLRAVATNRGKSPISIQLQDTPILDIQVNYRVRTGGNAVAVQEKWSKGKPLTPDITQLTLKPGESKSIEMDWVAQQAEGIFGDVELEGILRYGEGESDHVIARTFIHVDRCP